MSVLLILIPLSVLFAAGFMAAFLWSVRSGQYEDTTTPPMRMLLDESNPHKREQGKCSSPSGPAEQ